MPRLEKPLNPIYLLRLGLLVGGLCTLIIISNRPSMGQSGPSATTASTNTAWDCTQPPPTLPQVPLVEQLVRIDYHLPITPPEGRGFTTAIWSPSGDRLVFVSPTSDIKPVADPSLSTTLNRLVGVSRSELWLYNISDGHWQRITSDGSKPRFASDGKAVYFVSNNQVKRFSLATFIESPTGIAAPNSAASIIQSSILSDGSLLSFAATSGVKLSSTTSSPNTPNPVIYLDRKLAPNDTVRPSPRNDLVAVIYRSDLPHEVVLAGFDRKPLPILVNCPSAAEELTWSQDGTTITFPFRGRFSGIVTVNANDGTNHALVSLRGDAVFSNISVSRTGLIALAKGDSRTQTNIWVVSPNGEKWQRLMEGLIPIWSPSGTILLSDIPGNTGRLEWMLTHITPLNSIANGGNKR